MEIVNILAAGVASYAFGAVWYMILAKPWMAASGVEVDAVSGRPANSSDPVPYITAFVCSIVVAGLMRHIFAGASINTAGLGLLTGLGLGLFLVSPWIVTFYGFAGKPRILVLIDAGYATIGCGLIGLILALF